MQFGIAIYPSKEVRDFVNSYRKRFDPYYSVIAPHLTIREKEDWSSDKLEQASLHLEEVTKNWAPFSIHFNRFSSFYPVNNVIYLALSDPKPVTDLHMAINSGVLGNNSGLTFTTLMSPLDRKWIVMNCMTYWQVCARNRLIILPLWMKFICLSVKERPHGTFIKPLYLEVKRINRKRSPS
ncbi:2'-5' RNA ligase family protein [Paenibacillus larvae]